MIRFMTNIIPPPHSSLSTPDDWRIWREKHDDIIGEPQETPFYTAEQLRAQGYVGIYIECMPQEATRILNMSIDSYRRIPVLGLPEPDKESCMLHDAHRICRAFGEILSAGHPLVIETIDGRQYAVSAPPVIEGNSALVFGDKYVEIAKITEIKEVPHA